MAHTLNRWQRQSLSFGTAAYTAALGLALTFGCSSAPKKNPAVTDLSPLEGKKIALVEIRGEPTARSVIEVALVNQIAKKGSFILVPKQEIDAAKSQPGQDPLDWNGIAKRAGADYALRAKILDFDATTHDAYASEEVEDSELAAEQGKSHAKTEQSYKLRSLEGKVAVQLEFKQLKGDDVKIGVAHAEDRAVAGDRFNAPRLTPTMSFLEKLTNEAFRKFFDESGG